MMWCICKENKKGNTWPKTGSPSQFWLKSGTRKLNRGHNLTVNCDRIPAYHDDIIPMPCRNAMSVTTHGWPHRLGNESLFLPVDFFFSRAIGLPRFWTCVCIHTLLLLRVSPGTFSFSCVSASNYNYNTNDTVIDSK